MDAELVEAFKKLEAKIKNEKEKALRQERADALRLKMEGVEKEKKRNERIVYAGSFTFLLVIFFLIYYANESQIKASGGVGAWMVSKVGQAVDSSNSSQKKDQVNCDLPDNWKLPVCIEARLNDMDNKWKNMGLNKGGKEKPFAITKPE